MVNFGEWESRTTVLWLWVVICFIVAIRFHSIAEISLSWFWWIHSCKCFIKISAIKTDVSKRWPGSVTCKNHIRINTITEQKFICVCVYKLGITDSVLSEKRKTGLLLGTIVYTDQLFLSEHVVTFIDMF